MYARVFRALARSAPGRGQRGAARSRASTSTRRACRSSSRIDKGVPTAHANLPFEGAARPMTEGARVHPVARRAESADGRSRDRHSALRRHASCHGLRFIPVVHASLLRVRASRGVVHRFARAIDAARERVWAGMARESAHQLGTPLSSLSGWIELLRGAAATTRSRASAIAHMRGDLERLERVAHRFERIGREPQRDASISARSSSASANYFQARVPTLAHTRHHRRRRSATSRSSIDGDAVLLEWAIEVLTKNAIDALAGRGGRIDIADDATRSGRRVRASRRRRRARHSARAARAGSSSRASRRRRAGGASASRSPSASSRRITAASLVLAPTEQGATFEIILQGCAACCHRCVPRCTRQAESRAARGRAPRRRSDPRARRRRLGKDARAHDAHRAPHRHRRRRSAQILAVTFTNKAAGEMRERIATPARREPAGMWVGHLPRDRRAHAARARRISSDARRRSRSTIRTTRSASSSD